MDTERNPDSPDAWARLGEALRDLWRLADAEAAFIRATTLAPDAATAWAGLGSVQIMCGRIHEGIASCRRSSRLRSDLAAPHRHHASALLSTGRIADAARVAAEARRLDPLAPENLLVLAAIWFQAGLHAGARRLIDRVVDGHPDHAEARLTRGLVLADLGETQAAERALLDALAIKPWLAPAHAAFARLRRSEQRTREALACIQAARTHHPESEQHLLTHLDLLEDSGDAAAARRMAEEQLRAHPASRTLRLRLAALLLDAGALHEALRHIPAVLPAATTAAAWEALAANWQALGRERERRAALERALDAGAGPSAAFLLAQSLVRLGDCEGALRRLEGLPASTHASLLEAEALVHLGRTDGALQVLEAAAARAPDEALAHMRLGILQRQRREHDAAERALRRAVELAPRQAAPHEHLAILLSEMGRFDEAYQHLRTGLDLAPASPTLRFNAAVLLARQKRWAEAERGLREVLAGLPLHLSALGNLGRVLAEQQRHEEAIDVFEQAIEMAPGDVGARHGLLNALRGVRRHDEAVRAARTWIDDRPEEPFAWRALAISLAHQGDPGADEAAERLERLKPDSLLSCETRGVVAFGLGRAAEALEWFDKGLARDAGQVSLLVNRALALDELDGLAAARKELERAVEIEPESDVAQMNLSMVSLRLGEFRDGWDRYERRQSALRGPNTLVELKRHAGGRPDLSHASVLVRAEQGLGDTIQFMRYIPRLAIEARDVTFHLQDAIAWMAWGMAPNVRVCGYRDPVPTNIDYTISLLSLPGYYDTDLTTIPSAVPYLTPDPARVDGWRARLGADGFKVGVVWHTNPAHGNIRRWIPLERLAPLAAVPGVRLISLQKHHGLDQLTRLVAAGVPIETLGDAFDEGPDAFADTAAAVAALDLVITIDTSTCHLAGAMGRPVWVLLPRSSDWRWLTGRRDSPWYPTLRIFQQRVSGDWAEVAADLKAQLAGEVDARASRAPRAR